MGINYIHSDNIHTLTGPQAALPVFFQKQKPSSLLDVGCGTGTWLKAALDFGISEVFGVDGVEIPPDKLHVPAEKIKHQDLTCSWSLNRQFEAVICLEVAEHLDSAFGPVLIDALVRHGSKIYFSAACPGQPGQHHVNCQWPAYWQQLFNERGFVCEDEIRWEIWDDSRIEPWYRQNLFLARRASEVAGHEPRITPVIHPQMLPPMCGKGSGEDHFGDHLQQIENGRMEASWYLKAPVQAISQKLKRHLP